MDFEDKTESILLAAVAFRSTVDWYVEDWRSRRSCLPEDGKPVTSGMCNGVSYGLLLHLRDTIPEVAWRIEGGSGVELKGMISENADIRSRAEAVADPALWPGGMRDADGTWQGHWWVGGTMPDGTEVIVDMTADQFGHDVAIVEPGDDARYRANLTSDRPHRGLSDGEMAWGIALANAHAESYADLSPRM